MAKLCSIILLLVFGTLLVQSLPAKVPSEAADFFDTNSLLNDGENSVQSALASLSRQRREKLMSPKKKDQFNQRQTNVANAAMNAVRQGREYEEAQQAQQRADSYMAIVDRHRANGLSRQEASRVARIENPTLARQIDQYNNNARGVRV